MAGVKPVDGGTKANCLEADNAGRRITERFGDRL